MDVGEVVTMATYWGCKLRGPGSNYLIKGLLGHRKTEVCMSSPQLVAIQQTMNRCIFQCVILIYLFILTEAEQ